MYLAIQPAVSDSWLQLSGRLVILCVVMCSFYICSSYVLLLPIALSTTRVRLHSLLSTRMLFKPLLLHGFWFSIADMICERAHLWAESRIRHVSVSHVLLKLHTVMIYPTNMSLWKGHDAICRSKYTIKCGCVFCYFIRDGVWRDRVVPMTSTVFTYIAIKQRQ
jgi:hypothetical protein